LGIKGNAAGTWEDTERGRNISGFSFPPLQIYHQNLLWVKLKLKSANMRALDISLTDKNTPSFIHARANEDKI
jgi:hypothetical protein